MQFDCEIVCKLSALFIYDRNGEFSAINILPNKLFR